MIDFSTHFLESIGLRVSRLAVGGSHFGVSTCRKDVMSIVSTALDLGVNFFDTADIYGKGESESALGDAVYGRRHHVVIATKFGHNEAVKGASRTAMTQCLHNSLKRLKTDYIDLYQLHAPDPSTPVEETISTLQLWVKEGKIRCYGICNVKPSEIEHYCNTAQAMGGMLPTSVQNPVNILNYQNYEEIQFSLNTFQLGLLASLPLARGLLGGRYRSVLDVPRTHPLSGYKGLGYRNVRTKKAIDRLIYAAQELNRPPSLLALEVILANRDITSVLVGMSHSEQLLSLADLNSSLLQKKTIDYILGRRLALD
ncbi:aldo/keto reductase [Xenorhabdus griffiniae]|uniref:Aldo/keto reductase n=1 Tax=Xenorhabdus griffiniae TaxID=351672 RepID=A0ABY9XGJ3_9GAMM|nr:aldo/keto reductase [Xenorhabdus griffiniae]MBD1227877.1 aldo/keto reductase [Xenorhabdus griffiniae]MBE8589063.1 aldo/keto reductase [Xenorhabdus griffiniae]WMV72032.1 aldo/keto reductase [Xenorhabdus griffiniae]WNH01710.1 aldo/keto reductase [Xenorhabdus griffiniae]